MKRLGFALASIVLVFSSVGARAQDAVLLNEVVAWVNSDVITRYDLDRQRRFVLSQLANELSGEELDEKAKMLEETLLRSLIEEMLLVQMAEELGAVLNEEAVEVEIQRLKDANEITSDEDFEKALATTGMTVEDLKTQIRRTNLQQAAMRRMRSEIMSTIGISDLDVEEYYQQHLSDYEDPAKVKLRQIFISTDYRTDDEAVALANSILEEVRGGKEFVEAVRESSEGPSKDKDGDLGTFTAGEMTPELETVAFELEQGEISDVIKSKYGYHILLIEEKNVQAVRPLEEVEEEIRNSMREEQFVAASNKYLDRLKVKAFIKIADAYRGFLSEDELALYKGTGDGS